MPTEPFSRTSSLLSQLLAGRQIALGRFLVLLALLATSTGCVTGIGEYFRNGLKVGPNYLKPRTAVADHWIDYHDPRIQSNADFDYAWWRQFNDPKLDSLIYTAYSQNITLREAGFRVLEARALRGFAVGNLFPQSQTTNGAYQRRRLSLATGIQAGGGGGLPGVQPHFSIWNTGAQLAWEVDFWGRFRRSIESADAALDASVENYDDVLVVLIGDVADAYVEIRTAEQRLRYARANVVSQRNSLELARTRLAGGTATRLDVAQAITNVAQTEATIPQLETQLRQAENRLCVLMGMPPYDLTQVLAGGNQQIPTTPPQIAIGIPAELLRRRPDIRRAEREVAAQSALIGVAETDLYPAFTINGSIFIQANQFKDMFNSKALGGAVGPSFNWNVFNYGRIRNLIRVEEARFEQRVAIYQQTVLQANSEAEDAIVSFLRAQEQAKVLAEGVSAAEESRDLVNDLYKGGRADFGRVFVAELFLTQQQDALAQAQGTIARSMVNIYRALGGGWEIRLENAPAFQPLPPIEDLGTAPPEDAPLPPVPQE